MHGLAHFATIWSCIKCALTIRWQTNGKWFGRSESDARPFFLVHFLWTICCTHIHFWFILTRRDKTVTVNWPIEVMIDELLSTENRRQWQWRQKCAFDVWYVRLRIASKNHFSSSLSSSVCYRIFDEWMICVRSRLWPMRFSLQPHHHSDDMKEAKKKLCRKWQLIYTRLGIRNTSKKMFL